MPKFLDQNEVYRILQRELPEDVYADGPPSAFFTTADMYATASGIASLYTRMGRVYENFWPSTADELIDQWEVFVFGSVQSGLSLAERRNRVINQLKSQPTLALWEMLTAVANFVPPGTFVQVVEFNCKDSAYGWKLGVSRLGSETALGWGYTKIGPDGADLCAFVIGDGWRLGNSQLGSGTRLGGSISYKDLSEAQLRAYGYEVRIFGYTLSASERVNLSLLMKRKEPARSAGLIRDGLSLTDYNLTVAVANVDQFDGIDCVAVDATQTTGYAGRETP